MTIITMMMIIRLMGKWAHVCAQEKPRRLCISFTWASQPSSWLPEHHYQQRWRDHWKDNHYQQIWRDHWKDNQLVFQGWSTRLRGRTRQYFGEKVNFHHQSSFCIKSGRRCINMIPTINYPPFLLVIIIIVILVIVIIIVIIVTIITTFQPGWEGYQKRRQQAS